MAIAAEVSKKCFNFQIRQFEKNRHLKNIAANFTLYTMVSFIIRLITRTAKIDVHTDRQMDRQDNYCNPHCTCMPRVNETLNHPDTAHENMIIIIKISK